MSSTPASEGGLAESNRQETNSALFANLVIQQTNMALMLLGQAPHPQTGERVQDFEAARLFIDQLEMLELKTRGNLDQAEQQLLRQSLMHLRMAFVEAVGPASGENAGASAATPAGRNVPPGPQPETVVKPASEQPPDEESRKKFSKKY